MGKIWPRLGFKIKIAHHAGVSLYRSSINMCLLEKSFALLFVLLKLYVHEIKVTIEAWL